MNNPDSLLILGTGAMATCFAARCSAAGVQVTMLGTWPEALAALNRDGAHIEGVGHFPVRATDDPQTCQGARLALVLVKSWQTGRAAQQLERCLDPAGMAFTLQNGLGNAEILAGALGGPRLTRGITTLGVSLLRPGTVSLQGEGEVCLEQGRSSELLGNMLSSAGFRVVLRQNADSLVWGKLIVSSAINPITALLRIRNGGLIQDADLLSLAGAVAGETASVAASLGIPLSDEAPQEAVARVAGQTAGNTSSMLADVLRGARTEVDAINGAITKQGERLGLETPLNRLLWSLVKAIPFVVR
jgi:2-dehydropantoate 2-reductase